MKTRSTKIPPQLLIGIALAVIVLALAIYSTPHKTASTTVASPTPKALPTPSKTPHVGAGPSTMQSKTVAETPLSTSQHPVLPTLSKPVGPNNNMSTVSLNNGPTAMESTCRSVSGSSCSLQASLNGKTVPLGGPKTISGDMTDGVIFDWDAKLLSAGAWSVVVVSSKDGQVATSEPQLLQVNQ